MAEDTAGGCNGCVRVRLRVKVEEVGKMKKEMYCWKLIS